jgi:hypothetical protein
LAFVAVRLYLLAADTQGKYGFQLTNPVRTLATFLSYATDPDRSLAVAVLQVGAVTLLWAAAIVTTVVGWRCRPAIDRLWAVAAVVYWVVPLSLGVGLSPWRTMAMVAPFIAPLLRRMPVAPLWATLVVFLLLGWAMCGRFLDGSAI